MEVILTDGYGIELSVKAMKMYLERRGIAGYLYAWPDDEEEYGVRICVRIDDVNDFAYGYEPPYDVVSKDLGKVAPFEVVRDNLISSEYNLYSCTDETLIGVLRELKGESSTRCQFRIATIPDGMEWHIEDDSEYGTEWVQEGRSFPQRWYGEAI